MCSKPALGMTAFPCPKTNLLLPCSFASVSHTIEARSTAPASLTGAFLEVWHHDKQQKNSHRTEAEFVKKQPGPPLLVFYSSKKIHKVKFATVKEENTLCFSVSATFGPLWRGFVPFLNFQISCFLFSFSTSYKYGF